MAPSPTVKDVRESERTRLRKLTTTLQTALADTDAGLAVAGVDLRATTDGLAALQADEAELRRRIAAAQLPADAHQLELELEANLLAQRPQLAALARAQDRVAVLERDRRRVAAALDRAGADLVQAVTGLTVAERDDDDATRWRARLSGGAVAATVGEAASAAVTQEIAAARTKLEALLGGAAVVTLLDHRLADAQGEAAERGNAVVRAVDALDAAQTARAKLDGAELTAADAFTRVRDEVRAVVELGAGRLAAARAALQATAAAPGHTPAVQERIDDRVGDIAGAGADTPLAHAQAVLDTSVAKRAAEVAFEAKALVAQAQKPDLDPETDTSLATERTARDKARADAAKAVTDFSAADKLAVDTWEVAVPPATTALAVDALRATAAINDLRAVKPTGSGSLFDRLDAAEQAYATALAARLADDVRLQATAARVAERLDAQAAVAPVADVRLVALVRGDQ
jgi:hypothetical protein